MFFRVVLHPWVYLIKAILLCVCVCACACVCVCMCVCVCVCVWVCVRSEERLVWREC